MSFEHSNWMSCEEIEDDRDDLRREVAELRDQAKKDAARIAELERELADTRLAHELLEQEVAAVTLQGAAAGTVRMGPTEEEIEAMPRRRKRR